MAENNNNFNDESSAFGEYARHNKAAVSNTAAESSAEHAKKAASGGVKGAVKGTVSAVSTGVSTVIKGVGKIAVGIGIPKQVVSFLLAIVMLFTSLGLVSMDDKSSNDYADQVEKLCGGDVDPYNEQLIPKKSLTQEEKILRAGKIYRYLKAYSFEDEQIAGIISNVMADSEGDAASYEGDDINLNFEVTSMHHANWDQYTQNLFAVYASGTSDKDGFPKHKDYNFFAETVGSSSGLAGVLDGKNSGSAVGSMDVLSTYATNRDLYAAYPSQIDAEHLNTTNNRYLPGFGLFMWSGTRANDLLWYANSLTIVRDSDDDLNNDYVYELPFQIAYLLYENKEDVWGWATTDRMSQDNWSTIFMTQYLVYDDEPFKNESTGEVQHLSNFAEYHEYYDDSNPSETYDASKKLTEYSKENALTDFNQESWEANHYDRDVAKWHVAEANKTITADSVLYQYYGMVFRQTKTVNAKSGTQTCPQKYDPYGHMDDGSVVAGHEADVPTHDVASVDYVIEAVPVLYTLRLHNPEADEYKSEATALKAAMTQIEKIMWTKPSLDVYNELAKITNVETNLKAYIKDVEHGDDEKTGIDTEHTGSDFEGDKYRQQDSNFFANFWENITVDPEENYMIARFKTTGYWNWVCKPITSSDIVDIPLLSGYDALIEDHEDYAAAVARYVALKKQYDRMQQHTQPAGNAVDLAMRDVANKILYAKYVLLPAAQNAWKSRKDSADTALKDWNTKRSTIEDKVSSWCYYRVWLDGWDAGANSDNVEIVDSGGDFTIDDVHYKKLYDSFGWDEVPWSDESTGWKPISSYDDVTRYYDGVKARLQDDDDAYDTNKTEWDKLDDYLCNDSNWPGYKPSAFTESKPTLEFVLANYDGYKTAYNTYCTKVDDYNTEYNTYKGIYNSNHSTGSPVYDNGSMSNVTLSKLSWSQILTKIQNLGQDKKNGNVSGINSGHSCGAELNRVKALLDAAETLVNTEYATYNTTYANYVAARNTWEANRNKYHGKAGQRNEDLIDSPVAYHSVHDRYNVNDPYDQEYWFSTHERGFDTYWYQYGSASNRKVIDGVYYTEYQKQYLTEINDPLHAHTSSTNTPGNEADDYYWHGSDMERYVKYRHRYNVLWKDGNYTDEGKTNGYQKYLANISRYAYAMVLDGSRTAIRELLVNREEYLLEQFEKWLETEKNMVMVTDAPTSLSWQGPTGEDKNGKYVTDGKATYLFKDISTGNICTNTKGEPLTYDEVWNEFAMTDLFTDTISETIGLYKQFYVHPDSDIEKDLTAIISSFVKDDLKAELLGNAKRSVRFVYQQGEDLAYDSAVWFYRHWKGHDYVSDDNRDFKLHTDPARYWYFVIKSRGWDAYDANDQPMYNDKAHTELVDSYLTGRADLDYVVQLADGTEETRSSTESYTFRRNSDTEDVKRVEDLELASKMGISSTKYSVDFSKDAVNKIYDMHKAKVCGLDDLDISSPSKLAVSLAYPYGEDNYSIDDRLDYYEKDGKKIYPALKCTEAYVSTLNTIVAVENQLCQKGLTGMAGTEYSKSVDKGQLSSTAYAYYKFHSHVDLNHVNGKSGELLTYSDPGTMLYTVFLGSGCSPEMPISFEDQKRFFRYNSTFTMEQAAKAMTLTNTDDEMNKAPYNAKMDKEPYSNMTINEYFTKMDRPTGDDSKGGERPYAYDRGQWYLAGEITDAKVNEYTYAFEPNDRRKVPLYGSYKAVAGSPDEWLDMIRPGDIIMTDSNAYVFVGQDAYDKFKDYMTPHEAYSAVCTAWNSSDPTSQSWDEASHSWVDDPLEGSGIVVCTYNDLVDRGICGAGATYHPIAGNSNSSSSLFGFFSSVFGRDDTSLAQQANTLRLIYDYHKAKNEKVFIYRCNNIDYELAYTRQMIQLFDFSSCENGSQPVLVKYDGMQHNDLYVKTGHETLGTIYNLAPIPESDVVTHGAYVKEHQDDKGVNFVDLGDRVAPYLAVGGASDLRAKLAFQLTPK